MKNHNYQISIPALLLCGAIMLLSSCKGWFDVSPSTDVKAKDLYKTESGFDSALTGIYLLMGSGSTYAGDMSFGLLDQLAQQYDYLPHGASQPEAIYNYSTETQGGFRTKQRLASSWESMYNVIVNCNNFLKWLNQEGASVIRNPEKQRMYRGEALGLRAYCHFDLLRAWGPYDYKHKKNELSSQLTIPYRTIADNSKQPLLSVEQILEHAINDLNEAKELLSFEARRDLDAFAMDESDQRRFRFNYHAANATLARIYTFMGDSENAKRCAQEVINDCGLELRTSNQEDPALFSETIFGIHYHNMSEDFAGRWGYGEKFTTQYHIGVEKFSSLFGVSGSRRDDMRSKPAAFFQDNVTQDLISRKYIDNNKEVIPLIRLPEMHYILCEMTEDLDEAEDFINFVRNKRGFSSALNENFTDEESRTTALSKEYSKEFYAEGQYWYFLKRNGITRIPYSEIELSKERFEFPLPDAEKQYGWVSETDAEEEESNK